MMVVRPALVALAAANGMQTAVLMVCCAFAPVWRQRRTAERRAWQQTCSPLRLVQTAGRVALGGCGCRMLQTRSGFVRAIVNRLLREWHAVYAFRRGMCMFVPCAFAGAGSRRTHVARISRE